MKVNVTFRNVLSCTYARQFFLLILLLCGYGVVNAQVSPSVPATTKNHKKQVIGYITQWDAWKDVSGIVPKGGYNQLNVDYSQYTILNFSFFGVAKDGSLHSGDYRNKSIYQVGAVQELSLHPGLPQRRKWLEQRKHRCYRRFSVVST
jgi:chitinase